MHSCDSCTTISNKIRAAWVVKSGNAAGSVTLIGRRSSKPLFGAGGSLVTSRYAGVRSVSDTAPLSIPRR